MSQCDTRSHGCLHVVIHETSSYRCHIGGIYCYVAAVYPVPLYCTLLYMLINYCVWNYTAVKIHCLRIALHMNFQISAFSLALTLCSHQVYCTSKLVETLTWQYGFCPWCLLSFKTFRRSTHHHSSLMA